MRVRARRGIPGAASPTTAAELAGMPEHEAEGADEAAEVADTSAAALRDVETQLREAQRREAETASALANAQAELARERLARLDAESSGRSKFRQLIGSGPWTLRIAILEAGEDHESRTLAIRHRDEVYTLEQYNKRTNNKARPFLFNPKRETRLKTADRELAERALSNPFVEVIPE